MSAASSSPAQQVGVWHTWRLQALASSVNVIMFLSDLFIEFSIQPMNHPANDRGPQQPAAAAPAAAASPGAWAKPQPGTPPISWAERLAANSKASSSASPASPARPQQSRSPAAGTPSAAQQQQQQQNQQQHEQQQTPTQPRSQAAQTQLDDVAIASALSAISLANADERSGRQAPRPMRNNGRNVCYLNSCCQARAPSQLNCLRDDALRQAMSERPPPPLPPAGAPRLHALLQPRQRAPKRLQGQPSAPRGGPRARQRRRDRRQARGGVSHRPERTTQHTAHPLPVSRSSLPTSLCNAAPVPTSSPPLLCPPRSLGAAAVLAADRIFGDVLEDFSRLAGAEHRQQDAQEFLSFLLDQMHEARWRGRWLARCGG